MAGGETIYVLVLETSTGADPRVATTLLQHRDRLS